MCGFQELREHTGSLQQVLTQYLAEPSCPDGHHSAWRKGGNTCVSRHPWSLGSDSEGTLAREEAGFGGHCGSCEKKRERLLARTDVGRQPQTMVWRPWHRYQPSGFKSRRAPPLIGYMSSGKFSNFLMPWLYHQWPGDADKHSSLSRSLKELSDTAQAKS